MSLARGDLEGNVLTVTGPVDPSELGITLIHEHLFFDLTCYYRPPSDPRGRRLSNQPIRLSNLGWVRQNCMSSLTNLQLRDERIAAAEVKKFLRLGGRSIVDATSRGIGRDPVILARLAAQTGANIICGSGYYVHFSQPSIINEMGVKDLKDEIVSEIANGVNGTDVRPGLIGEIGASWPMHANEEKCLRAAALAHVETGAPLSVHPGHDPKSPMQIINILTEEGVNPGRVVMSHIENRYRADLKAYIELAQTGCCLGFDTFGREQYFVGLGRQHPSDDLRMDVIVALLAEGYGKQIMLAQDCCFRSDLNRYGGHGYGHILENIRPRLRLRGVHDHELNEMLIDNPKSFLKFH